MRRRILRTDGSIETIEGAKRIEDLRRLIGADTLDIVNLRHLGSPLQVMLVDDTGLVDGKPVNEQATKLYHANCRPGTTHPICGDVAIVFDEDFA